MKHQNIISVTSGVGTGSTCLSAFDKALWNAGIADHNLIYLSSIIPRNFIVLRNKPLFKKEDFGNKLYVVISSNKTDVIGDEVWAGIGWVTRKKNKKSDGGLFVEHSGSSEKDVQDKIRLSLEDMTSYRLGDYSDIDFEIIGLCCKDRPVCVLAAAVFCSVGW